MKKIIGIFLCCVMTLSVFSLNSLALNNQNEQATISTHEIAIQQVNDYIESLDVHKIEEIGKKANYIAPMVSEDGALYALTVYEIDTTNIVKNYSLNSSLDSTVEQKFVTYVASTDNMIMLSPGWTDVKSDPTLSSKFVMTISYDRITTHPTNSAYSGIKITNVMGSATLDPGVQITSGTLVYGCSSSFAGINQSKYYSSFRNLTFDYNTGFTKYAYDTGGSVIGAGWTPTVNVRDKSYTVYFQMYLQGP